MTHLAESLAGREIAVPGSTSNLGAGFDALGLALGIRLRLRVVEARDDDAGRLAWQFDGAAPDGENLIERALRGAAHAAGLPLPSLRVAVANEIPMKAGLGSSAAAIVAGLRLFELVHGPQRVEDLLAMASALEGHPDNTSASLLGGFVVSCPNAAGGVTAIATRWPDDLRVVVATPRLELATKVARAALPAVVPFADAVFNLQRSALLVQAIAGGSRRAIREAVRDRLHQPFRAPLVPGLARALAAENPPFLGAFLSGAGPSLAAIVDDDGRAAVRFFEGLYAELDIACAVRVLDAEPPGRALGPGPASP